MKNKSTKGRSTTDVKSPKPKSMAHGMKVKDQKMGPGFSRSIVKSPVFRKAPKLSSKLVKPKKAKRY